MTDKQIIIDGCDVSGCRHLDAGIGLYFCSTCNPEHDTAECNEEPNCYYKQLKRKEQECEELKETFDGLFKVQYKLADNNKKLRQCLTEIKEIAENAYCLTNGTNKDMANFAKQILQKISEVEDGFHS